MAAEVRKHPEWRELAERIQPLLDAGRTDFTYEQLSELSGVDVRTVRGRWQFYRFRKELLEEQGLWFENIPKVGYAVILAGKQPEAAYKRVRSARRKVTMATAINGLARIESMSPAERLRQAQLAVLLHELGTTFKQVSRRFSVASAQLRLGVDESTIAQIADSPKKPARKVEPPPDEPKTKAAS